MDSKLIEIAGLICKTKIGFCLYQAQASKEGVND